MSSVIALLFKLCNVSIHKFGIIDTNTQKMLNLAIHDLSSLVCYCKTILFFSSFVQF